MERCVFFKSFPLSAELKVEKHVCVFTVTEKPTDNPQADAAALMRISPGAKIFTLLR